YPGGGEAPPGPCAVLSFPGSWDCSPPAASLRRRRLARRPGYMRSTAGPGIRFPAVDTPFQDLRGVGSKELHHSASRAGQSNLGRSSHDREPLLGSCVPNSSKTPAVASVGHRSLAQTSAGGSPMGFWIHPRAGTGLPARLAGLRGPNDAWGQQESLSMDSSAAPGTSQDPTLCAGARGAGASRGQAPLEGCGSSRSLGSGPAAPHTLPGSCESFTSSFSFIRLSLGSAGERGEAEGCLPSREAETTHQSPQEMGVRATSPDRSHEDPPGLPQPFRLTAAQGLADLAQVLEKSSGPECGLLSSLNMDTGCSSSLDPSLAGCGCDEGSGSGDVHGWDTLLKRWEPVLRDSLLSTRRHLEVTSLRVKLQKLQEAVIEDDDFDKGELGGWEAGTLGGWRLEAGGWEAWVSKAGSVCLGSFFEAPSVPSPSYVPRACGQLRGRCDSPASHKRDQSPDRRCLVQPQGMAGREKRRAWQRVSMWPLS
uniref:DISC1 scaffold protein n=1 Tax=Marmota marmota marmota TaxID=9994 RepID=A0A8C5ZQB3_MARMA